MNTDTISQNGHKTTPAPLTVEAATEQLKAAEADLKATTKATNKSGKKLEQTSAARTAAKAAHDANMAARQAAGERVTAALKALTDAQARVQ